MGTSSRHTFKSSTHTFGGVSQASFLLAWESLYESYDKTNEFSNFKCNLVSQFNKLQDNSNETGSKDTFLRNSLLSYN